MYFKKRYRTFFWSIKLRNWKKVTSISWPRLYKNSSRKRIVESLYNCYYKTNYLRIPTLMLTSHCNLTGNNFTGNREYADFVLKKTKLEYTIFVNRKAFHVRDIKWWFVKRYHHLKWSDRHSNEINVLSKNILKFTKTVRLFEYFNSNLILYNLQA